MSDAPTNEDTLAGLREAARRGKQAEDENAALRRELLFTKAGIDTSTKIGQSLFASWAGDLDDLNGLKAEFDAIRAELGVNIQTTAPEPTTPPAPTVGDGELQQRIAAQQALEGGKPTPADMLGKHPRDAALEEYHQAVQAGVDPEIARTDAMAKVISAANKGDARVFFDVAAHQAAAQEVDRLNTRKI